MRNIDEKLLAASRNGEDIDMIRYIHHGANIHYQDMDGFTALHWAAKGGYLDIIQLFISFDMNIEIQDNVSLNSVL